MVIALLAFAGGVVLLMYFFNSDKTQETNSSISRPMTSRPIYLKSNYHWRASPNFDPRPLPSEKDLAAQIDTIVLHATELPNYDMVEAVFTSREYKVSSHYTIDRDGNIYSHVDESQRAWHAGESLMADGRIRINDFSIGIELVNANDGFDPYPRAQIQSLKELITDIRTRHIISHVVSHAEIATPPGRKSDPKNFPWHDLQLGE
jgi:N-acetyl-anhydromuramyl-L-alanine amidase AmpD